MGAGANLTSVLTARRLRSSLLAAVALNLALIGLRVLLYSAVLSQSGGTLYVLEPVVLLLVYAGLGLGIGATDRAPRQGVLRQGTAVGLISGGLWSLNIALESFADLGGEASGRTSLAFILGGFLCWGVAGVLGARRAGEVRAGVLAAVWSAMVCVLTAVAFGFLLLYTSLPRLERLAATSPDYARSGWQDLRAFAIANQFDSGFSHLLFAPLIGLVMGTLGALLGAALGRRRTGA